MRMEDQVDALLSLGPALTFAAVSRALCADAAYMEMRTRRMMLRAARQTSIL
jgi:hypothetical protein